MKNSKFLRLLIIFASFAFIYQCKKNPIPYDLSNSEVFIDTLTVDLITGGTYLSPPLMGSTEGLYFGNQDGNENLFTLLQFRNLSYTNSIYTYNLLDEDVTLDSLVFTFSALDTNLLVNDPSLANINFELYYFPAGGDSIFDEDESNYLNLTESQLSGSVAIGQGHFIEAEIDSEATTYPTLSVNVNDIENVLDFLADTNDTENRTFMLKNLDPIDGILPIRSRESASYPILTAHYRVDDDTLQSIFYPLEDITIVKPRQTTQEDIDYVTVSRASGLKSILQLDLGELYRDSTTTVIKTAELYIYTTSVDSLSDWDIVATVLDSSINITDFWAVDEDNYTIMDDIKMNGTFEYNQLAIQIRDFIQGYTTESFDNNGLKLYVSTSSDPFKTIHFIVNQDDPSLNPYLRIAYVKL